MPEYDDLDEVINRYGYPLTPEGTAAAVDKIVADAHAV